MIFALDPQPKSTSSIMFIPIYTWIIAIWLFIATTVVLMLGTIDGVILSIISLV